MTKQVLTDEQIESVCDEAFADMLPSRQIARRIESAVLSAQGEAPIDMVLHCPACGRQHIDKPNTLEKITHRETRTVVDELWTNPPHRSHKCHNPECGYIWRPADVPTNGVQAVKTKGKADSPIAAQGEAQPVSKQRELALLYADQCDSEAAEEKRLGNDSRAEHLVCMAHVLRQLATPPAAPSAEARDVKSLRDRIIEGELELDGTHPPTLLFLMAEHWKNVAHDYKARAQDYDRLKHRFSIAKATLQAVLGGGSIQAGMSNDQLRAALRAKLPTGAYPEDEWLTPFALGVEVGAALAAHGGAVDGSAA